MLIEVLYQCLKNYSHCAYYINILQRAAFKDISISALFTKKSASCFLKMSCMYRFCPSHKCEMTSSATLALSLAFFSVASY